MELAFPGGSHKICHDLGHVSSVGSVLYRSCTDPAQHLRTAGYDLDDLDRDLSDLLSTRRFYGAIDSHIVGRKISGIFFPGFFLSPTSERTEKFGIHLQIAYPTFSRPV